MSHRCGRGLSLDRLTLPLALALGLAVVAPRASAFNGFRQSLPNGATPSLASGLSIDMDAYWFEDGGYRPITIRLSAGATKPRDRQIVVRLYAARRNGRDDPIDLTVTQSIVLPAGQTSAEATLYLPGYLSTSSVWWDVTVDGEKDKFLSVDRRSPLYLASANRNNNAPTDLRQLKLRSPVPSGVGSLPRRSTTRSYDDLGGLLVDDATASPAGDWLEYSATDVVRLDLSRLRALAEDEPANLLALRRWCISGGMIWVEAVDNEVEALSEVAELLRLEKWRLGLDEPPGVQSTELDQAPGWRRESLMKSASTLGEKAKQLVEQAQQGGLSSLLDSEPLGTDSRGWYAVHGAGLGRVYAFPQLGFDWPKRVRAENAKNAVDRWANRAWAPRHGLKPGVASPDFAHLLIPGVGIAPVGEFQVLITLFVLGIGPLNYWLLYRAQRLDLFVVTTPLIALAVTGALFTYATLSDGFGVQVRARSLTVLNQAEGEAVTWARLCHFAGLGARGQFVMPDDAMVYPIRVGWENAFGSRQQTTRELAWTEDAQRLVSGWMPARTSVQHLVVRAGELEKRIQFGEPAGDRWEARNELGAEVTLLIAQDAAGDWWKAENAAADGVVALQPTPVLEAVTALRTLALENLPAPPIGAGRAVETALDRLGARQDARAIERELATVSLSGNLMNNAISRLAGLEGGKPLDLPPRSFVAITDETVAAPLGFERVAEEGSFHVIVGTW